MNIKSVSFLAFVCTSIFYHLFCFAQPLIIIPYGSTPDIDGTISSGEWDDAHFLDINVLNNTKKVNVLFKHDSVSLHVAFLGNLMESMPKQPEILLDINYDRSTSWLSDDWWFHVSYTDCEYQGEYENYDNCQLVRPNWTAVENFPTDTVEIQIPFSTIGINILAADTIGLSFELHSPVSNYDYWPSGAIISSPATWGRAVFVSDSTQGTGEEMLLFDQIIISPNPNQGDFTLYLKTKRKVKSSSITLFNVLGKIVYSGSLSCQNAVACQFPTLSPGTYIIRLTFGEQNYFQKLVVY